MILVEDIWKAYDDIQVLKGLSLKVHTGETLVILGRSGVGKSVLLRLLLGLEKPQKGTIYIDDVCVTKLHGNELFTKLKNVGMLFQGSALFDSLTVEENVSFYFNEHKTEEMTQEKIKERVNEALQIVGLEGTNKKMPAELSGGMRKRAALARVFAYKPTVVFYDEPTTGLDPITASHINELINKVQKELQATSIVVTHDIVSALSVADRLALHDDGKIKYIDTPQEFLKIDDPIIAFLKEITHYNKYKNNY